MYCYYICVFRVLYLSLRLHGESAKHPFWYSCLSIKYSSHPLFYTKDFCGWLQIFETYTYF